jgi:class 3 adenylate cyclase
MQPALPTGTVTFLFSDVEGSTRLVGELGAEAYATALLEHRRVMRAAFARHGGVEVDAQGDAFFVACSSVDERRKEPGSSGPQQAGAKIKAWGSLRSRQRLPTRPKPSCASRLAARRTRLPFSRVATWVRSL